MTHRDVDQSHMKMILGHATGLVSSSSLLVVLMNRSDLAILAGTEKK
jgi:hypothetical protein